MTSISPNEKVKRSTFESQSILPQLPLPTLEDTLNRFCTENVPALLSVEEVEEMERVTNDFGKKGGDGEKLQKMLSDYRELKKLEGAWNSSFVEEFWSEAYLAPDTSVVLNLNPFFLFEDGPDAKMAKDQLGRAASLVYMSCKMAVNIQSEKLAPDEFRGHALCMDQFKALFGSSRVPREKDKDVVEVVSDSGHVVVLYQNQMYCFQALWPSTSAKTNGDETLTRAVAVDEYDIRSILQSIVDDGDKYPPEKTVRSALGVLTTLPRKIWAQARENLCTVSSRNRNALEIIDSALFVLCLDKFFPENIHEAASNMLHGTNSITMQEDESIGIAATNQGAESKNITNSYQSGTCCNRWYDKLQIIVTSDGGAGINFEHSAIDGHTSLRFASDIYAETVVSFAQSITKSIYHNRCQIPNVIDAPLVKASEQQGKEGGRYLDTRPKKLTFDLPETIMNSIFFAETALADQIVASDTHVLEFKNYGKKFIIANKMSPDSFVQITILLAYYLLYGQIVSQYEPVLTKRFFHGRTEAMRTATKKAATFCKMFSSKVTRKEEKVQALKDATFHHSKIVKECAEGKGVERHLFALKCIAERNEYPIPDFFHSKAWQKLNHTVLSTSNCGNPALRLFGFGPVVQDGFGIGYIIKDNSLQYSISSKHRQTRRFADMLRSTLIEVSKLLNPSRKILLREESSYLQHSSDIGEYENKSILMKKDRSSPEYLDGMDFYGETEKSQTSLQSKPHVDKRASAIMVGRTYERSSDIDLLSLKNLDISTPKNNIA